MTARMIVVLQMIVCQDECSVTIVLRMIVCHYDCSVMNDCVPGWM